MKKNKSVKNIKIFLVTFMVIIGGMIIAGILFTTKSVAGKPGACTVCGETQYMVHLPSQDTLYTCSWYCQNHTTQYQAQTYNHAYYGTTTCSYCGYSHQHTGGTHLNRGICSICNGQYQTHTESTSYKTNYGTTHKVIETCSLALCDYKQVVVNSAQSCSGGTHPNGTCDYCGYKYQTHTVTKSDNGDGQTHTIKCSYCGNMGSQSHTYSTYTNNGDGTHSSVCAGCGYKLTEAHKGATHDNGGKCTASGCNAQYETHEATETIVDYTDKNNTTHTPLYKCTHSGCTSTVKGTAANHVGGIHSNDGTCTTCTHKYQTHEQSTTIKEYKKAQSGHTPVYKCTEGTCDFTYDGEEALHSGATHDNDGICIVEGCGYQYEIHQATTTVTEYVDITETKHTPVYTCSFDGCTSTVKGTAEDHTGGTHENGGICTLCKKQYQNHGQSTEIVDYIKHEDLHIELYKCTEPTCTKLLIGLSERHRGGTHENDGKCTVCSYQYQIHGVSDEFARYEITETGHTVLNKCTFTGCEGTHKMGEEEAHTGGTHENDGICTVCDHQYQIHGVSDEFARYEITETGHTVLNKCTFTGCEGTHKVGEEEAHKGGTHENDGICTVCSHQYQIHGVSDEQVGYYKTETGHTELYKCTFTGCEGTHKVGEEEPHEGGTHENDGICTICNHKYQTHEKTTEIAKYMIDETVHLILYKCSHPGCTTTYPGTAEDHKGGTHENGGKCTVCEYQYQAHNASEEVVEYDKTQTGHTPKYKCTYEGCEGLHIGEEKPHEGGTHDNDGKCTECDHQYQTHGKSDDIKEYQPTENGHKPIYGCTDQECPETYEGEEESHSGATHDNGGKCEKCEEIYEEHGKSDEIKEYKPTDNGHKPIYECTNEECEGTYEGEEEPHNVEEWTDNGNGVHSGECTDCGEEVTEEHDYGEDGKCEDCEAIIPEDECEHTYVIEKNETHHWNFCPKCKTTKEGSLELHKYGGHTVNEDGTHSVTCTVCEYKLTEKHNYEMKHDETQHWKFCPKCETIEDGTKGNHTYGKYVDNGDGTHSRTCTVCNYKQTEKHNEECDKCKEKESTSGSGDNATNGDNTTADKEIPKAGIQNMILGLIVSIGVLAIITTFKMKKYKDI